MFKKDNFAKYTVIMTEISNKKGNKTFIMFLFWIGKQNIAQVSFTMIIVFILNVTTLRVRIIISILPPDRSEIILPTANKIKKISCLCLTNKIFTR